MACLWGVQMRGSCGSGGHRMARGWPLFVLLVHACCAGITIIIIVVMLLLISILLCFYILGRMLLSILCYYIDIMLLYSRYYVTIFSILCYYRYYVTIDIMLLSILYYYYYRYASVFFSFCVSVLSSSSYFCLVVFAFKCPLVTWRFSFKSL